MRAFELVGSGMCSGQCLVAREGEHCTCVCQGVYHGRLKDIHIDDVDHQLQPADSLTLKRGDVVALGLRDGYCLVGRIDGIDERWIRLDLLDFLAGLFGLRVELVDRSQVQRVVLARPMGLKEKIAQGYAAADRVYDTDPLGDFQTRWERARR